MKWRLLAICLQGIPLALYHGAHAAIDDLEAARQQASGSPYTATDANSAMALPATGAPATQLQWEPITGAPYLVEHGLPLTVSESGPTSLREIAIHVPAHALLRVAMEEGAQAPAQFLLSNGSGVAIVIRALPAEDGRNWLIKSPLPHPAVVHVRTSSADLSASGLRFYLGRMLPPPQSSLYPDEIRLPGDTVNVRRADEATAQTYTRIGPDINVEVPVTGPMRLAIEYQSATPDMTSDARLVTEFTLVGEKKQTVQQLTGSDDTAPVNINGHWYPGVRREHAYVDVPDGGHVLRIQSSHTILARVTAAKEPEFLLPGINFPEAWNNLPADQTLSVAEQQAIATAGSNAWRNAGLLAADWLDDAARTYSAIPALRTAADELAGKFSEYQDAVPISLPTDCHVRSYPYFIRMPQSPDDAARHDIGADSQPQAPVPMASFYTAGQEEVRFYLTSAEHRRRMRLLVVTPVAPHIRIEIRYDNGQGEVVTTGVHRLDSSKLRPIGLSVEAAIGRAYLQSIGPALQEVSAVEWEIPMGVTSVSVLVRAIASDQEQAIAPAMFAVQELQSTEFMLDDQFLAQLARGMPVSGQGQTLLQDALRPLQRRLDDAKRQFVANVQPHALEQHSLSDSAAQRIAEEARSTSDPLRALELWSRISAVPDPALRIEALQGRVRSLLSTGDRYTAEHLLRANWIGNDSRVAKAAANELTALYAGENDIAMQTLFAAAQAATDRSHYTGLAQSLAAEGNDDLALMAGLVAPDRNMALLMQSALRARRWQTFDALLASVDKAQEQAFWSMQRLLAQGKTDDAWHLAEANHIATWAETIQDWERIASMLAPTQPTDERETGVSQWLQWYARHPGPRRWVNAPALVRRHAGGVTLRSIGLNLAGTWWRANSKQPMSARVVGPARIRIEARPVHDHADGLLTGWLEVRGKDQRWMHPFHQNQVSTGLALEAPSQFPGTAIVREIDLPQGIHDLEMDAGQVPVIARIQVERPALPVASESIPDALHFEDHERLTATAVQTSACGAVHGCQIIVGRRLYAQQLMLARMNWTALPAPLQSRNEAAARMAAGDISAAIAASTSPAEQMALLLWQSQHRPDERPQALALGADIASRHPTADVLGPWQQIEANSAWTLLPIVDRSAGLRSIDVPPGSADSPDTRMRAALLGPLQPGEVRLAGDSRVGLWINEPKPLRMTIDVVAEELPGNAPLPLTAVVERNGKVLRRIQLDARHRAQRIPVQLYADEQQLAVYLEGTFVNQFARVRFTGLAQPIPAVSRDWHLATPEQPVQATIAGPTWIRIDRHTTNGVQSEERLVTDPASQLTLTARPGERETLYRIFIRRIEPVAAEPKRPRPNQYLPQPVPEAPQQWLSASNSSATHVRLHDAYPLDRQAGATISSRFGLMRRQDAEATGEDLERQTERFAEAGISWRHGSADQQQFRLADLFIRRHWAGSPSIGLRLGVQRSMPWTPAWPYPWDLSASVAAVAQNTPDGLGTSLSASLAASQERRIHSTLLHRPTLEFQARGTNLEEVTDPGRVDNEIYTRYRKEHPWAISISDTLSWRPWRDSHGSLRVAAVSNPNFNIFKPDHINVDVQWRQLAGPFMLEAGARVIRFLEDDDRRNAVTRRDVRFGTSWEHWMQDGTRLQVQGELRRNLATGEHWGGVQVQWHWEAGRGYRDFAPDGIDFRSLRSWHRPPNTMRVEER